MKTIVLTGGGTAGHVTPHLALIPELKKKGYEVHYIGTENGIEHEMMNRIEGRPVDRPPNMNIVMLFAARETGVFREPGEDEAEEEKMPYFEGIVDLDGKPIEGEVRYL